MDEKTSYEIITRDGKYRVELPSNYQVTFGPIAIGGSSKSAAPWQKPGSGEYGSMALRVYEGSGPSKKQRAIVTGVRSFRDLSIPFLKEAVREKGKDTWYHPNSPDAPQWSQTRQLEYDWIEETLIRGRLPKETMKAKQDEEY